MPAWALAAVADLEALGCPHLETVSRHQRAVRSNAVVVVAEDENNKYFNIFVGMFLMTARGKV